MESDYPGLWQRWFRAQAVAVGWPPDSGYPLIGKIENPQERPGWIRARIALQKIQVGDWILVSLEGKRIARIGEVTAPKIADDEWDPLVPRSAEHPNGEMGRRINVRWDLENGPLGRDMVVQLPETVRFKPNEARSTIAEIKSIGLDKLQLILSDPRSTVGLFSRFKWEVALSDWISVHPHRLEDGMLPHPSKRVREYRFSDSKRADIILVDRRRLTVVVECKQNTPSLKDVAQLRHYMEQIRHLEGGVWPRGLIVHGGARNLRREVEERAHKQKVEIFQYRLEVDITRSR